jgi:hypothetical protein
VEILFIIPRDTQASRGCGAAAWTARTMPHSCPHGHAYTADSATIVWESCPCWTVTRGGHHLITCRACRQQRLPALVNVPECIYLDF